MAHLTPVQQLAAGMRPPPSLAKPFSTVQAAWRFLANDRVGPDQLAHPLIECARADVPQACDSHVLVALDWSPLHFGGHTSKRDRVVLANREDLGYELLTALALSDKTGSPLAPLCLELRAANGTHSSRAKSPIKTCSPLDALAPVMAQVASSGLSKEPVFIIDRGADSVGHYRVWDKAGHRFLVRADDARQVLHDGVPKRLGQVADELQRQKKLTAAGEALFKGKAAARFVAETTVVLHRPARTHRVDKSGKKKHRNVAGPPITLRLIVSEVRGPGGVLARWLLLTNLPAEVSANVASLWYYWRWRIESYHKLLKGAGQQLEQWQQETASALLKRLLLAAMSTLIVWRLAREDTEQASKMRDVLVRLSGRQIKRGKNQRPYTEPALLAGLGVLLPMLDLLLNFDLADLKRLAQATLPNLLV